MSNGVLEALRAGRHDEAIRRMHVVVDRLRPAHPDLCHALMLLGQLYLVAGRPAGARPHLEAALELAERRDDRETPTIAGDLGLVYLDLDLPEPAAPLLRRWLAEIEQRHGATSTAAIAARHHLALACAATGAETEAADLLRRNLSLCERQLGAGHEDTRATRDALSSLGSLTGRQR